MNRIKVKKSSQYDQEKLSPEQEFGSFKNAGDGRTDSVFERYRCVVSEKIDGSNLGIAVRLMDDGSESVQVQGRHTVLGDDVTRLGKFQLPRTTRDVMIDRAKKIARYFRLHHGMPHITVYGEYVGTHWYLFSIKDMVANRYVHLCGTQQIDLLEIFRQCSTDTDEKEIRVMPVPIFADGMLSEVLPLINSELRKQADNRQFEGFVISTSDPTTGDHHLVKFKTTAHEERKRRPTSGTVLGRASAAYFGFTNDSTGASAEVKETVRSDAEYIQRAYEHWKATFPTSEQRIHARDIFKFVQDHVLDHVCKEIEKQMTTDGLPVKSGAEWLSLLRNRLCGILKKDTDLV